MRCWEASNKVTTGTAAKPVVKTNVELIGRYGALQFSSCWVWYLVIKFKENQGNLNTIGLFGSKIHSSSPEEVKGKESRNECGSRTGGGALRDDPKGQYLPNQKIEKLPHATHLFAEEAKAF